MQKQIMLHLVAGYPTLKKSEELAYLLAKNGADYLEIQIPFSDPVADGPTIMQANEGSLKNGTRVMDCFNLMKILNEKFQKEGIKTKLLFMSYYNILFKFGVEKFCKQAKEAGCWGFIIPDIPIDEEPYEQYVALSKKYGIKAVQVISPLTPINRLKKIAKLADGLVYCVSKYGTTGHSNELNPKLGEYILQAKNFIKCPLAVGFGISKKEHLEAVWKNAQVAVIGSAVINAYKEDSLKGVEKFLKMLGI